MATELDFDPVEFLQENEVSEEDTAFDPIEFTKETPEFDPLEFTKDISEIEPKKIDTRNIFSQIKDVTIYGAEDAVNGLRMMSVYGGDTSDELIDDIVEYEKKAQKRPINLNTQKYQEAEGWGNSIKELLNDIETLPLETASGLGTSIPSIITGAIGAGAGAGAGAIVAGVGAAPGAAAGGITGVGLGSGMTEAGTSIRDFLAKNGVDLTDREQVKNAVSNKELMSNAKQYAITRGAIVGAFDAASAGVAGKFLSSAKGVVKKIGGGFLDTIIQGLFGAGGEAGATLATGEEIQPQAVLSEFFAELPSGVAETAGGAIIRKGGKASPDIVKIDEQLKQQQEAKVALEQSGAPLTAKEVASEPIAELEPTEVSTEEVATDVSQQPSVETSKIEGTALTEDELSDLQEFEVSLPVSDTTEGVTENVPRRTKTISTETGELQPSVEGELAVQEVPQEKALEVAPIEEQTEEQPRKEYRRELKEPKLELAENRQEYIDENSRLLSEKSEPFRAKINKNIEDFYNLIDRNRTDIENTTKGYKGAGGVSDTFGLIKDTAVNKMLRQLVTGKTTYSEANANQILNNVIRNYIRKAQVRVEEGFVEGAIEEQGTEGMEEGVTIDTIVAPELLEQTDISDLLFNVLRKNGFSEDEAIALQYIYGYIDGNQLTDEALEILKNESTKTKLKSKYKAFEGEQTSLAKDSETLYSSKTKGLEKDRIVQEGLVEGTSGIDQGTVERGEGAEVAVAPSEAVSRYDYKKGIKNLLGQIAKVGTKFNKKLANLLKGIAPNIDVEVDNNLTDKNGVPVEGKFDGNKIFINGSLLKTDEDVDRVILHETIHAVLSDAVNKYQGDRKGLSQKQIDILNRISQAFNDSIDQLKKSGVDINEVYGVTSLQEFVAEVMANGQFRGMLDTTRVKNDPLTLWQRVINAIVDFLGVGKDFTQGIRDDIEDLISETSVKNFDSQLEFYSRPSQFMKKTTGGKLIYEQARDVAREGKAGEIIAKMGASEAESLFKDENRRIESADNKDEERLIRWTGLSMCAAEYGNMHNQSVKDGNFDQAQFAKEKAVSLLSYISAVATKSGQLVSALRTYYKMNPFINVADFKGQLSGIQGKAFESVKGIIEGVFNGVNEVNISSVQDPSIAEVINKFIEKMSNYTLGKTDAWALDKILSGINLDNLASFKPQSTSLNYLQQMAKGIGESLIKLEKKVKDSKKKGEAKEGGEVDIENVEQAEQVLNEFRNRVQRFLLKKAKQGFNEEERNNVDKKKAKKDSGAIVTLREQISNFKELRQIFEETFNQFPELRKTFVTELDKPFTEKQIIASLKDLGFTIRDLATKFYTQSFDVQKSLKDVLMEGMGNILSEEDYTNIANQIENDTRKLVEEKRSEIRGGTTRNWAEQSAKYVAKLLANPNIAKEQKSALSEFRKQLEKFLVDIGREEMIDGGQKQERTKEFFTEQVRRNIANWNQLKGMWDRMLIERPELRGKLASSLSRPFTSRQFESSLRELGIKINNVVKDHYSKKEQATIDLFNKLTDGLNLDDKTANEIKSSISKQMDELTTAKKKEILERELGRIKNQKQHKNIHKAIPKLIELSNLGLLDNQDAYNAVSEPLGLPHWKESDINKIIELTKNVQDAPKGSVMQRRELARLKDFISSHKNQNGWTVLNAYHTANVLGELGTLAVNIVSSLLNTKLSNLFLSTANPRIARIISKSYVNELLNSSLLKQGWVNVRKILLMGDYESTYMTHGKEEYTPVLERLLKNFESGKTVKLDFNLDDTMFHFLKPIASPFGWAINKVANNRKFAYMFALVGRTMAASDAAVKHQSVVARELAEAYQLASLRGFSPKNELELVREVGRILGLTDDKGGNYVEQAELQLEEEAKKYNLNPADKQLRLFELIRENRPAEAQDIFNKALAYADDNTFNNEIPRGLVGALEVPLRTKLLQNVKLLKLFIKFTRTMANITNTIHEYTPGYNILLPFMGKGRGLPEQYRYKYEGLDRHVLWGKIAFSNALTLGLVGILFSYADDDDPYFMIYGDGPDDANLRKLLMPKWKPNTVKIGNVLLSFRDFPFLGFLKSFGDVMDAYRYGKPENKMNELTKELALFPLKLSTYALGMPALAGLKKLFDIVMPDEGGKGFDKNLRAFKEYLRFNITGFFPAGRALKSIENVIKSPSGEFRTFREDGWLYILRESVPFASMTGKPDLNIFGEPIKHPRLFGVPALSRFAQIQRKVSPLDDFIIKTNTTFGWGYQAMVYDPEIGASRPMTKTERYEWIKEGGPKIKEALESRLPYLERVYNRGGSEELKKVYRKIIDPIKDSAKKRIKLDK